MKALLRAAAAVSCLLATSPALADILIDNVNGVTVGDNGEIVNFSAVLIGDDGRIEQVFDRRDKKPGKVDYRLDGKGRVMIPGLIDSNAHVMELGFARLKAKAGFTNDPQGDPRPEDRDLAFAEAQSLLLASGFTTVTDMGTTIADWQSYRRAGDAGALRIRLVTYADSVADMTLIGGPGPGPWLYADRLKMNGVTLTLDGPLETREAWLKAPYTNDSKNSGQPRLNAIQLRNLISRGAIDNFQVAITANGDAAASAALDALDEVGETYTGDRRWRIEALGLLNEADIARMARHKASASVQPLQFAAHRAVADTLLGADRTKDLHRWRTISAQGTPLAFGSGTRAEAPRPFAVMAMAISRQVSDDFASDWQTQEALTRQDAFKAFTSDAAHAMFADGRLGRIARGYRADFLLIDRDPMLAGPQELRDTRVLQSWIGGTLVYDAESGREQSAPARPASSAPATEGR